MQFFLKQGDTRPKIRSVLTVASDSELSLAGAAVVLVLKNLQTGVVTRRTATLIEGLTNQATVEYSWVTGDTASVCTYAAEWELTVATQIITFPNDSTFTVIVGPDLR